MNKTTATLLTALLVIAYAIELAYNTGKASAPYIKQAVAFTITCTLYLIEAAKYVYTNRREILDTCGRPFIYESPVTLRAPQRIRYTRPANTLRYA